MTKEQGTNPWGEKFEQVDDAEAARELRGRQPVGGPRYAEDTTPATEITDLVQAYPNLDDSELERLDVLKPGTQLRQGSVYLDLAKRTAGPFRAIGGQVVREGQWVIAKRWTDYDIWNRLAGDHQPRLQRPA